MKDETGFPGSTFGFIEDITHQEVEVSLRESEHFFSTIISSVGEGVIVFDCNFHYRVWNQFMEHFSGVPAKDVIGKLSFDIFPHLREQGIDKLLFQALAGKTVKSPDIPFHVPSTGQSGWYVGTYAPLKTIDGKIIGVVATVQDISDRKRTEEERHRFEIKAQQAQKLESLGILAGGIAHDFNNLLMVIIGNSDLAFRELPEESPVRSRLGEIRKVAHRAAELCQQMLAYSGKGRFIVQSINLSDAVKEIGHMLEISVSKKVRLHYHLSKNIPSIEVDVTQIRQIIMNLIINASEAIGERTGAISISTGSMECDRQYFMGAHMQEAPKAGKYVYLEVADTGSGMDDATMKKIFDPFFTTKFTGRGLGLAAVLGIVRGHKGEIKVNSTPGKGTTFRILFPASHIPPEVSSISPLKKSEWKGSGVVLLVDDDEAIRFTGRGMLELLGFDVLLAENGYQALEVFRKYREKIRCVLLDLTMPKMDGEETLRELRRIEPTLRVILSSGYNEQEVGNRFAGKGIFAFIQKPYQIDALFDVLMNLLGK